MQIKQETEGRKKEMVKKEYPTLKTSFWGSKNPKKVFSFAIPYGRTVRKSNDSKIHFLFELGQENNSLLTVVDDYCDTSFDIVEGKDARERLQKKSLNEAVERQKRLLDARRINTN